MSSTTVTATITDSAGQVWANGQYIITFVPNPNQPSANYQWNGANFVPQVYQGSLNGSGAFSVSLPDNSTITPSGSAWQFVLIPNATAPATTITVPAIGASVDYSSLFSARVLPPKVTALPMPRAYSSAEVPAPPLLTGGQFFNVTQNVPYFWNGTTWVVLAGTVQSVGLSMPPEFTVSGSPVTTSGTLAVGKANEGAFTVYANQTAGSAQPSFGTLTAQTIAQAGTLSNSTTGNANTATTAGSAGTVAGGYVASIIAGTAIGVSPGGGQGNVTVSNTGVTSIVAGTGITISGATGAVTVNAPGPTFTGASGHQTLPSGLILQWGHNAVADTPGTTFITFPVAFPNACFVVNVTDDFARGTSTVMSVQAINTSPWTGTFSNTGFYASGNNPGSGVYWIAIGY